MPCEVLFDENTPPPARRWAPGVRFSAVGVDEAGCGALAGPVVAAAVALGAARPVGLDDSKKLAAGKRRVLCQMLMSSAPAYAIALATPDEIDDLNILGARLKAMARAVEALGTPIEAEVLIDGNKCPDIPQPSRAIVGGDALIPAISAASVLAKVYRDFLMAALAERYPQYQLAANKGYPTPAHKLALGEHGPSPAHRQSFAPCRQQRLGL